jgi:hypothetical protein
MKSRSAIAFLVLAVSGVGTAAAQQAAAPANGSLGRLFFTPERRAALERQRQLNIQETQALEGSTMSLDGIVVRSSGRRTVWINKHAQHDSAMPSGVAVDISRRKPGQAVLSAGEEAPARLNVGESINRATREKADPLGGGQVGTARPAR